MVTGKIFDWKIIFLHLSLSSFHLHKSPTLIGFPFPLLSLIHSFNKRVLQTDRWRLETLVLFLQRGFGPSLFTFYPLLTSFSVIEVLICPKPVDLNPFPGFNVMTGSSCDMILKFLLSLIHSGDAAALHLVASFHHLLPFLLLKYLVSLVKNAKKQKVNESKRLLFSTAIQKKGHLFLFLFLHFFQFFPKSGPKNGKNS